jgi:hypothetical protein
MKLVWVADQGCGGFGDRLVGLVSAYFIAQATNRQFFIWWKSPDMSSSLVIRPEYLYHPSAQEEGKLVNWIDKRRELIPMLQSKQLFQGIDTVFLCCNQFLVPFLSQAFTDGEIRSCYQSLLTKFFDLTTDCRKALEDFQHEAKWNTYSRKLAFQVRFGDHQIRRFQNNNSPNPAGLDAILSQLHSYLQDAAVVYFSSDCDAELCLPSLRRHLPDSKIIYCRLPVEHIDRTRNTTVQGHRKLLIDFLMMAACDTFVIPWHSNLSRTAVLASPIESLHGVVYAQPLHQPTTLSLHPISGPRLLYCKSLLPNVRIN